MLISIVYDSGYGHTARQALALAEGARRVPEAEVRMIAVVDGSMPWESLAASDAIIFGSPTYNGSVSARFKQFMEDSTNPAWSPQKWRNKIAAGFTNSGAMHGDKLNSLIAMQPFMDVLKLDGTLVNLGALNQLEGLSGMALGFGRKSLAGSMIGGIAETQAVIDYCAARNIKADIELIRP